MIGWLLWFFLALHLFLAEGLAAELRWPLPDVTVLLCAFCVVFARTSAIPGILLCAAVGRALAVDSGLALQVLVMGIPVAVLLPLRGLFFRRYYLWQCAAVAFLAVTVPKCALLLARFLSRESVVAPLEAADVLWSVALVPPLLWILRLLPPLNLFLERGE